MVELCPEDEMAASHVDGVLRDLCILGWPPDPFKPGKFDADHLSSILDFRHRLTDECRWGFGTWAGSVEAAVLSHDKQRGGGVPYRSRLSNDHMQLTGADDDSPLHQAASFMLPEGPKGPRLAGRWLFRFNLQSTGSQPLSCRIPGTSTPSGIIRLLQSVASMTTSCERSLPKTTRAWLDWRIDERL
jgi:hypothetical protein